MKQLLAEVCILAETYFQEETVYPDGIGMPFWAIIISGGPYAGTKLCSEKQFYLFYNKARAFPPEFRGKGPHHKEFMD